MLAFSNNLPSLMLKYQKRRMTLRPTLTKVERENAKQLKVRLVEFSSGPYKTAWLQAQARKRGAGLYSRRAPAPPANPGIINAQTGRLKASWFSSVGTTGWTWETQVKNSSPEFEFMGGTSKMIPRMVVQLAMERERQARLQRQADAKFAVLKA